MPETFFTRARDTQHRLEVVRFFADVEARRSHFLRASTAAWILDRSVHTLIAHSFAEEAMFGYEAVSPTIEYLKTRRDIRWPDIILLIKANITDLLSRRTKRSPPGILADHHFDQHFYRYFERFLPPLPKFVRLCYSPVDELELARIVDELAPPDMTIWT
jgi:hypothetical protein